MNSVDHDARHSQVADDILMLLGGEQNARGFTDAESDAVAELLSRAYLDLANRSILAGVPEDDAAVNRACRAFFEKWDHGTSAEEREAWVPLMRAALSAAAKGVE